MKRPEAKPAAAFMSARTRVLADGICSFPYNYVGLSFFFFLIKKMILLIHIQNKKIR